MRTRLTLMICLFFRIGLWAQSAETGFFDPERDPVGRMDSSGNWTPDLAQDCLVRSLKAALPEIGAVLELKEQRLRDGDYLVFKCREREHPDMGLYVAVRLRKDAAGRCFADQQFQNCRGEPCSDCRFAANGCFCADPAGPDPTVMGICNHSISTGMAFKKVKLATE